MLEIPAGECYEIELGRLPPPGDGARRAEGGIQCNG